MAIWLAGIIGGLIAGAVMLGGIMSIAPFRGFGGFFAPPKMVAGVARGEVALREGMGTAALGLLIHLLVSAALGFLFALLAIVLSLVKWGPDVRFFVLPVGGMIYALIAYALGEYIALPLVNRPMFKYLPPVDFALMHILYGLILGWFIALMA